jgi:F-type H+-transporting ATPase subunit gamma
MAGTKELRRRIRSIKNTRQTTRAMEMVSASKLRRAEQAYRAAAPYGAKLSEMLSYIVAAGAAPASALFQERDEIKRRLVVLFAADRGLCGGYNNNLFKVAHQYLDEQRQAGIEVDAIPVGRRANDFLTKKRPDANIIHRIPENGGKVSLEIPRAIAAKAIEEFQSGRVDEVVFLYNRFVSTIVYRQTIEKFLPISKDSLAPLSEDDLKFLASADYIFEPSSEDVFNALLPKFIESKVYVAFASAITAEHSARMVAMSAATKNSGELIDKLTLAMNKKRQAAITTEIIEVISGAQALEG